MFPNIFCNFIHNMAPVQSNLLYTNSRVLFYELQAPNFQPTLPHFLRKLLLHYINNNIFTAIGRNKHIVFKISANISVSLLNFTPSSHAHYFKLRMHSTYHPCSPSSNTNQIFHPLQQHGQQQCWQSVWSVCIGGMLCPGIARTSK